MVKQNKHPYSVDAARAKLFAAEVAMDVTTKAVQIHLVDMDTLRNIQLKE